MRQQLLSLLVAASAMLIATLAFGQGFMVKPMKMEVSARPGDQLVIPLELSNTAPDTPKTLELHVLEITQSPEGAWLPVEDSSTVDVSRLSSCARWVSLETPTITVPPSQTGVVQVNVSVPHNARGVNFAAIIAQTTAPRDARGIRVVMRFLIPLIVEIQGRPERQNLQFGDIGLTLLPKKGTLPSNAAIVLPVSNAGRTFPRIGGSVKVSYLAKGERWLNLANVQLKSLGVVPGSQLLVPTDLGRSLPSGRYKLVANLEVDGRRIRPVEREFDFEGDPAVTRVPVDSALLLDPVEMSIAGVAGATRTMALRVQNASEDTVKVTAHTLVPPEMLAGSIGGLTGESFSCASWLSIVPAEFTLRPNGRQNLRVIARVPDGFEMPACFAILSLKGEYEDGQSAGQSSSLVIVENPSSQSRPASEIAKVSLSVGETSRYVVQARIVNVGNCRVPLVAKAAILGPNSQPIAEASFSGMESPMFPLENRTVSAELDFGDIPDGDHFLRTAVYHTSEQIAATNLPVRVSTEDGQKIVTVLGAGAAAVEAAAQ